MKTTPTLALAICSIGFFSALPAAHAQTGWRLQGATSIPSSVHVIGTGSMPTSVTLTTVTSTASASTTPFTFASSSSSASTQPPSVTASASASGGTVSGNNNPGISSLSLNPGGVLIASLTLNLDAFANGNVYVSPHLFSCASSTIVSLGAPTVP